MTKNRTTAPTGLWNRTTRALGKLLAGMVSSADDRRHAGRWTDYPTYPPF
ncbi:MAG TPA: hypothetical protein VNV38_15955 [Stellaceae bacterium]|jgi:hypothetical protein|nr:hypothetical protein [Stellaceae bacterium]